jgi:hypothetical protein
MRVYGAIERPMIQVRFPLNVAQKQRTQIPAGV